MTTPTALARKASRASTYRTFRFTVGRVEPSSIGVATGEQETWTDPRDGREVMRDRLVFLPRSKVAVVQGLLRPGEEIVLDVPSWLVERTGVDQYGRAV